MLLICLNLFLNLLILKHEIDSIPFYKSKFLLNPEISNINSLILNHLHSILRNDVVFVTKKGSESIFEPYCKYNLNLISKNEKYKGDKDEVSSLSLFTTTPLSFSNLSINSSLNPNKTYFFLDSKFYIPFFKDFDFVDYDFSLNYTDGEQTSKLFIKLFYKLIKKNCKNLKLGDTDFYKNDKDYNYKNDNNFFKEVKLSNKHIGIIHKTIYENNDLFKEIQNHFINFYKNIKPNTIFLELSEKYIKSLIEFLLKKGIEVNGKNDNLNDNLEDLFPFHFYKNITKKIEENNFITGGICLKNGKERFIMTGIVKKDKGMMYIEIV